MAKVKYSGFPKNLSDYEEKKEYLENIRKADGVELDVLEISNNPALRTAAKLSLNCIFGRMAIHTDKPTTKIINKYESLTEVLADETNKLTDFHLINYNTAMIQYRKDTPLAPTNKKGNIFVASFVTSYGRIHLHQLLSKLGRRILYFDTDGVKFTHYPNEWLPPLGGNLGELACETPGTFITEFCSTGPKSYSFKTENNNTTIKLKGITLNRENSKIIHFDSFKNVVYIPNTAYKVNVPLSIINDKKNFMLRAGKLEKTFKKTFNKRSHNLMDL